MHSHEASGFVAALGSWAGGSGPAYRRLARAIRERAEAGALAVGARLPAERLLAGALGVSRTTVVAAYDLLRNEGWVESRRGSGSRVRRSGARGVSSGGESPAREHGGFERATILRSLVEASGSKIEFMGLHLPAATPYVAQALAKVEEDVRPLLAHHGYWPLGFPALREAIASHLTRSGLPSRPEEVLITHGAQEAIGLAASLFLGPGRTVILEDPTYVGAIDVFAAAGARLVPVPVAEHGVRLDQLREAVAREGPSLIYLMPTFHNPTGVVAPESHRREIARIAVERGIPILEDDALANLDLGHLPPPPISSFAPSAPVLSAGSLSKLMWGGLRVGWIRAPEPFIARLARRKALGDLGNSAVAQAVAARLLPRAEEIRESRRRQITERLAVMEAEMARLLPEWTWRRPRGGLSLWVRLPRGNAAEFAGVALRHGVSVLPGPTCSPSNGCAEFLRLPFVLEPPKIREGLRLLARAWSAYAPAKRRERASLEVLV
jgi:DNA-binding transcriptional MocR family regulator